MLFVGISSQSYYINKYNEKITAYNSVYLYHLKESIESNIVNPTINMALSLSIETINTMDLHYFLSHSPDEDNLKAYKANKFLKSIANTNDIIDSIYFYYEHENFVISSGNGLIFLDENNPNHMNYKSLNSIKSINNSFWTYFDDPYIKYDDSARQLTYVYLFSNKYNLHSSGYVAITINNDSIENLVQNMTNKFNGHYFIIDQENNILVTTDKSDSNIIDKSSYLFDYLESNTSNDINSRYTTYSTIDNTKMIISLNTIDRSNWKLISISSLSDFYYDTSKIRVVFFLIYFCTLISGIVMSVIISSKMYSPIKKIVESIQNNFSSNENDQDQGNNEYAIINETLTHYSHKVTDLESTIQLNRPIIKHKFIHSIIKLTHMQIKNNEEFNKILDIKFDRPYYQAILLVFDSNQFNNIDIKGQLYIKHQIIEFVELYKIKDTQVLITDLDRERLVIISNSNAPGTRDTLSTILKDIEKFTFSNYGVNMFSIVSTVQSEIINLYKSYNEMMIYREYQFFIDYQKIYFADQFKGPYKNNEDFILNIENFDKALRNRDVKDVNFYLEVLLNDLSSFSYIHSQTYNHLQLILRTLVSYIKDIQISNSKMLSEKAYEQFNNIDNVIVFHKWISDIINTTYKQLDNEINKIDNSLIITVKKHIEEHIGDDISLDRLSDLVNISPRYLSKVFKEKTGTNFLDYVTNCRLETAASLLKSTELKISTICEKVGYFSTSHFIKKFKERYGMTPNQFRNKK